MKIMMTEDPHILEYSGDLTDPLVELIVNRLAQALADEEVRRQMDMEDERDRTIARLLREKDAVIEEQGSILPEKEAAPENGQEEIA